MNPENVYEHLKVKIFAWQKCKKMLLDKSHLRANNVAK